MNSAKSDSDFAAVEFCCRGRRPRRPAPVCPLNPALSVKRLAHYFNAPWHIVYHMARLHNLVIPQNLVALQMGCRGRQPLQLLRANLLCRKIATLGADFYFILVHNYGQLCQFLTPHLTGNSPSSTISSAISLISSQS